MGATLGLIRAPSVRRANILSNDALSGGGTRGVARTTRFDRVAPGLLHQSLALELVNDLPASCLVPDHGPRETNHFPRPDSRRARCAKAR